LRAFDPFFTTKGVGKGTGPGLSQVYGFVRQSGGHVKIYSEVGVGTTVKIYLPRQYGTSAVASTRAVPIASHRGSNSEVVLVLEDEERVRAISMEALRDLGYTAIGASNPEEALRLIEDGFLISLLFTDVIMPVMSGRDLADRLRQRNPALKVLYTTGNTRNAMVNNGILEPGASRLTKPFSVEELAIKVRQMSIRSRAGPSRHFAGMERYKTIKAYLRADAAECALIRDLATDPQKRMLCSRLADHLSTVQPQRGHRANLPTKSA
jgi:CheY-like chemotaxis protein